MTNLLYLVLLQFPEVQNIIWPCLCDEAPLPRQEHDLPQLELLVLHLHTQLHSCIILQHEE